MNNSSQNYPKHLEPALLELVLHMERNGFKISASGLATGYWISTPNGATSDVMLRFGAALEENPDLKAAMRPYLLQHRSQVR